MMTLTYEEAIQLRGYLADKVRHVDRKISACYAEDPDRADLLCAAWCALKDAEAEVVRRLNIMERASSCDWSRAQQIAGLV